MTVTGSLSGPPRSSSRPARSARNVPDPVQALLKYVLLALLYLFMLRVIRAVWVETRQPAPSSQPQQQPSGSPLSYEATQLHGTVKAPPGPEKLVGVSPAGVKGREFPLGAELTVGRAPGCAVLLDGDSFVSQLHARVFRRDGGLFVEDLGSTNGTFLNGVKVTAPVSIVKGDKIQFGKSVLEVRKS